MNHDEKKEKDERGEREREEKILSVFRLDIRLLLSAKVFWCIVAHVLCLSYAKKLWWSNTTLKSSSVCWLRGNEKCVEQAATNLYRSHINKSQVRVSLNRHRSLTASYPALDGLWCVQVCLYFQKQNIWQFTAASYQERDETGILAWRKEIETKQYTSIERE